MFQQFKNIDTAFRHIRLFSIVFLLSTGSICIYTIYRSTATLQQGQKKIYVMLNGKLMDALAIDRSDSLSVEIRDHVKMFHYYFYSLQPSEVANKKHLTAALYLADNSAREEYENLMESGYYAGLISGNITQQVDDFDSIKVNVNQTPYYFKYFGKLRLTRPTSILTRSLITEGYIRVLGSVDDKNPHGFMIERWKVVENRDLSVEKR
jgi:conjugative transposon TraK protein